ncbi:MAG: oxygen-independent coproporphyrinogen III oxidase [Caulobacterales bacterium]
MTLGCTTALHLRRLALLHKYGVRAPRYTSYPTAVQFTPKVDTATYEAWLGALPEHDPVSLYVHVPFCKRLCWFCGCNTRVVNRGESIGDYVALLCEEIALVESRLPGKLRADEVHLGGGTPNLLSIDDLRVLFGALRQVFRVSPGAEISAEMDPVSLTEPWVRAAVYHGLTRASLGVQDLSPDVQAAVNRNEPFEVVADAARLLRGLGVASLNLDLMYGLPRQRTADVLHTLDRVLTLRPERLALFGYAHVPWMKPHQKLIDEAELPDLAARLEQSEAAAERLAREGYMAIGLDHFALPTDSLAVAASQGRLRRNFQGYVAETGVQTLLGFGVSAIGQLPQGIVQNQPTEIAWRKAVVEGRLATARGVAMTADDRLRGEVIERLMCEFGVDLAAVAARHDRDVDVFAAAGPVLDELQEDGLISRWGSLVTVSEVGRPFVRAVCAAFDAYLDRETVRHAVTV